MKKIVALDDGVIVRQNRKEEKSNGIIIPVSFSEQEKQIQGVVVSCGIETKFNPGDEVLFSRYLANEFEVNGEKLFKISKKDIYCVLLGE